MHYAQLTKLSTGALIMKCFTLASALLVMFLTVPLYAQTQPDTAATTESHSTKGKHIQNSICPVSKEAIGSMGPGKKVQHKGYEFSLCCAGCIEEFEKNPDAYLKEALKSGKAKRADKNTTSTAAATSADAKAVNNPKCPVSGAPVGSMQAGSHIVYKGMKVGLCCDGCIGKFNEDPEKYLKSAQDQKS